MLTTDKLETFLKDNHCDFSILTHDSPIISTQDAAKYFDIEKAAPTFIMDTEQGLIALIAGSKRGRLDFNEMKQALGFSKLKMADKAAIENATGYKAGSIPLIGHELPCVFDNRLLENDYIYGGFGNEFRTLKITPNDVLRLNNVIKWWS